MFFVFAEVSLDLPKFPDSLLAKTLHNSATALWFPASLPQTNKYISLPQLIWDQGWKSQNSKCISVFPEISLDVPRFTWTFLAYASRLFRRPCFFLDSRFGPAPSSEFLYLTLSLSKIRQGYTRSEVTNLTPALKMLHFKGVPLWSATSQGMPLDNATELQAAVFVFWTCQQLLWLGFTPVTRKVAIHLCFEWWKKWWEQNKQIIELKKTW